MSKSVYDCAETGFPKRHIRNGEAPGNVEGNHELYRQKTHSFQVTQLNSTAHGSMHKHMLNKGKSWYDRLVKYSDFLCDLKIPLFGGLLLSKYPNIVLSTSDDSCTNMTSYSRSHN